MKSYTNLEQSKRLAEILPTESADMSYEAYKEYEGILIYQVTLCPYQFAGEGGVPCWSLAALLEVLPNKYGRGTKSLYWFDDAWYCDYMDEDGDSVCWAIADSPIDAVYKMICWLKENNKI